MLVIFFNLITFSFDCTVLLESFTFEDKDDYEYKILLKVFSRIVKKYPTQKASLYYFLHEKLVQLFLLEKF